MTTTQMVQRQERFGTAAQWTTANTVLLTAEIGIESDTGKGKIGDGTTVWISLPYSIVRNIDTDLASKSSYATPTNAQTGTTYTFALLDAGKTVTASNAGASSYNIPLEATVEWGANTELRLYNIGAGTVTVSCTSGTLAGTVTIPQYGFVTLKKAGTNTWYGIAQDKAVPSGGMVLVAPAVEFTAQGTVSINNCFSSTYDNYRIELFAVGSTNMDVNFKLRVGGSDTSGSDYRRQVVWATSATVTGLQETGQSAFGNVIRANTYGGSGFIEIFRPALSASTFLTVQGGRDDILQMAQGVHSLATSYDGFTLTPNTGNMTGTLHVYGYRKSL